MSSLGVGFVSERKMNEHSFILQEAEEKINPLMQRSLRKYLLMSIPMAPIR
jgi:hypothetical protein